MSTPEPTVEEFMQQLRAISEYEGRPFGRLRLLSDAQTEYEAFAYQYRGYGAVSDAFKCFVLETVERVNTEIRPKVVQPLSEFYGLLIPRLLHSLHSYCGAERLAFVGYPLQAFSCLRNVFDGLVLTSAALQRLTNLQHRRC